jgi:hypothetical protein
LNENNILFKEILTKHMFSAIDEISEKNLTFNITQFKSIVNSAINHKIKGQEKDLSYEVKSRFSGRGRAWAKIKIDESCETWLKLKNHLSVESPDVDFNLYTDMLDLFTSKGFGWVRYSGSNSRTTNFKIRYLGGKNTKGINLSLNNETAINLENLDGVPHKLGLEEGMFEKSIKKEKIEIEVSKEELNSFGIQTLESFLKEDV